MYMMTKTEFIEELIGQFSSDYNIEVREVCKSTSDYTGMIFKKLGSVEGSSVAPTLNIDNLYEIYKKNGSFDEIVNDIDEVLENSRFETDVVMNLANSLNKEYILANVTERIVPDRAALATSDYVSKDVLDLKVLYQVKMQMPNEENAYAVVTNNMCKSYGISVDELTAAAYKNRNYKFMTMADKMRDMGVPEEFVVGMEGDISLGYVSNASGVYGAAALNCPEFMEFTSKLFNNRDFVVIPSSVHELLIFPYEEGCIDRFNGMVNEVNHECVKDEEILSDHVYIFSRDKMQVMMPDDYEAQTQDFNIGGR